MRPPAICPSSVPSTADSTDSLKDTFVKATTSPKKTLLQRLQSCVQQIAKFEELFFDDPDRSVKRIAALEIELLALKSSSPRNLRKDSALDALF